MAAWRQLGQQTYNNAHLLRDGTRDMNVRVDVESSDILGTTIKNGSRQIEIEIWKTARFLAGRYVLAYYL